MLRIKIIFLWRFISLFLFTISSYGQGHMQLISGINKQKISFEFNNNLIVIPVDLNGSTLNFILDSGASKTILFGIQNSDSIPLNNSKKIKLRGLGEGTFVEGIISNNNQIRIENIIGVNQTVYVVLDDKYDMSGKMGKTIHGIIGYNLLKHFIVDINYTTKRLVFYRPNKFRSLNTKKYQKFDLKFHHNKPYINADISINTTSKHQVKLLIDTGSSDALWLFEDAKLGITVQNDFFKDHLGEGLSGSIEGKRSKISSFKLGSYIFNNPTTAFLDSLATKYARSYKARNGSIGSRILKRFRVVLDYPNQNIYLKKSSNFDKEFRYNRAGIELVYAGKTLVQQKHLFQNTISGQKSNNETNSINFEIDYKYIFKPIYGIYKIREDSPAALAGLKVHDMIQSVNGKSAYEYKMSEINALFYGSDGSKIKIVVEREISGVYYTYQFQLKKLL